MAPPQKHPSTSRRTLLKQLGLAPLVLRAAPFYGEQSSHEGRPGRSTGGAAPLFHESRIVPHYPARSPLADVLRMIDPGSDEYATELYAHQISLTLQTWGEAFTSGNLAALQISLGPDFQASPLTSVQEKRMRVGGAVETARNTFPPPTPMGAETFLRDIQGWIGERAKVEYAEFEVISIQQRSKTPLAVQAEIRYEVVTASPTTYRKQRTGTWSTNWLMADGKKWELTRLQRLPETVSTARRPVFVDVTQGAMGDLASFKDQLEHGSDHWRSILDGACGIDIYGNNGVAVGDYDGDGHDDLYVSQPAGLPNRLYRNRGDGTFEDVTDKAGVGVLDNTSCALFADLRNVGLQDLVVVCGSGPLLFVNQGDGTFRRRLDAFQFATRAQGTFTHAAIADYDLDGRLDIYFCLYSYYLGLDQYHYPVPYFDARNGPPNFLFHNQGDGTFVDRTTESGLNVDNDRYSFACAWGQSGKGTSPDLYVVNDFGRNVLYRSNGNGTFTAASTASNVEDVGAGMSACWADTTNEGRSDLYAADMWSAAGKRVSEQAIFQAGASKSIRDMYRRHANGNALYQNEGDGTFRNVGESAGVDTGRWAWCSDFWDFDHDGYADLYVTNGYITAPEATGNAADARPDLGSFFWRQVVAKSPNDSTPSLAYEHGWNALNELIRSDYSWSGLERNVMFANNRDGTFSEVSGVVGLDLPQDGRSFALADFDGDGRLEVVVKNRNAPQIRILHNAAEALGDSLTIHLRGTKSNRDGIGASVSVTCGTLRQKKFLQAGSGFLAQHAKDLFFGLGTGSEEIQATVHWPSGIEQQFHGLPRNSRITIVEDQPGLLTVPFAKPAVAYQQAAKADRSAPKDLSNEIETWLIDPLKAPTFSLPDGNGTAVKMDASPARFTLLQFCSLALPQGQAPFLSLEQQARVTGAAGIKTVFIVADQGENAAKARAFVASRRTSSTTLFATEEVLGIYNIIYRYLFDRRRDLPLPCSFLLDASGMIVKVYQGAIRPANLLKDVQSIPTTPADRQRKALPFAGTAYQSDFLRNDFTYGVAMFQHGYLAQAEESFLQVVNAQPNNAEGYYNLGTLSLRRNDFAKARTYLQRTLKLKPDYAEAWNNLGMMAAQEGRAGEAIDSFQQSLRLRPGYTIALLNLGNIYRRQGDAPRAKETLTRALELQPDDPEANYSLGMFYAQQNQPQPAEEYLQRAIALRPDYPEALNNLGVLLVRKGDYARAEQQFSTCIRLDAAFEGSYFNLARLYLLQQRKADAKATLEQLLRLRPENAAAKQALDQLNAAM